MMKYESSAGKRTAGFTLTELMVTVAIIGILGAVAYPAYVSNVQRANRNDARAAIARIANEMERFYATNGRYSTSAADFSLDVEGGVAISENGHYTIALAAGASGNLQTSYMITATPADGGSQVHDSDCAEISLDSQGNRLPDPDSTDCW